ncbi:MAG: hypothetical protein AAB316_01575, partial [Bacteroidota bacterium]
TSAEGPGSFYKILDKPDDIVEMRKLLPCMGGGDDDRPGIGSVGCLQFKLQMAEERLGLVKQS